MPENMQNQMPRFSEVKLQKQVWSGGQALLVPVRPPEQSRVWVSGDPESRPLSPPLRPGRRALGRGGAEEEERKEAGSSPLSQA